MRKIIASLFDTLPSEKIKKWHTFLCLFFSFRMTAATNSKQIKTMMSVACSWETTHGDFVMSNYSLVFFTYFANTMSMFKTIFARFIPPKTIILNMATTPPFNSTRPFCQALTITKRFSSSKIRLWADNYFTAPLADFSKTISAGHIRFTKFSFILTFYRTINLCASLSAITRFSTNQTWFVRFRFTPTTLIIALRRAKISCLMPIFRVSDYATGLTNIIFPHSFHALRYITVRCFSQELRSEYI